MVRWESCMSGISRPDDLSSAIYSPRLTQKRSFDVTYNEIFAERKSQSIKIPLGLVEKDADVLNPHKYITDSWWKWVMSPNRQEVNYYYWPLKWCRSLNPGARFYFQYASDFDVPFTWTSSSARATVLNAAPPQYTSTLSLSREELKVITHTGFSVIKERPVIYSKHPTHTVRSIILTEPS
jgi:hypothetical protein